MAIELRRDAEGKIERINAWGIVFSAASEDAHRLWVLKRRTIFPYCPYCWRTRGMTSVINADSVPIEQGRYDLAYVICGSCLRGSLRLKGVYTDETSYWATTADNPLAVAGIVPGDHKVETTVTQGFAWWRLSSAAFATLFYYNQFGGELYGALGDRCNPLRAAPPGFSVTTANLLNGAMLKAFGAVKDRTARITSLLRHYSADHLVAGVSGSQVYIGLPASAVKFCRGEFGRFSFAEALRRFVEVFKLPGAVDDQVMWLQAMDGLFSGEVNQALSTDIEALIDAGALRGPFARSTKRVDAELNNVLASLGKDKGLTLETIHRLYGRI